MEKLEKYRDINRTVRMLREQVIDSIPTAYDVCPKMRNPEALFKWLRLNTRYKSDPEGFELIQSMHTLLTPYQHRSGHHYGPGRGDCDCFVVTTLACLYVQGPEWQKNFGLYLLGRSKKAPVHIYSYINWRGKDLIMDLTRPYINDAKHYPRWQKIQL